MTRARWAGALGGLLVFLVATSIPAALIGSVNLFGLDSERAREIFFQWRVPRVLLAGLVGASLALAGAIYQALIRNPLASPYILGVSHGGTLGAVLAIQLGLQFSILGVSSIPIFSFLGCLGAILLVTMVAKRGTHLPRHTLLLTGVVANSFFGAGILLVHFLADAEKSQKIVHWMMGSIYVEDGYSLPLKAFPFIFAGSLVAFAYSRQLDLMSLGEEQATSLGVNVVRTRWILFGVASLLTGAAVSISGPIGFVGLVVPHMVRLIFGSDHRLLLPAVFFFGASFLILADTLARTLLSQELPVGVITAMLGGPFFLWLLRTNFRRAIFE